MAVSHSVVATGVRPRRPFFGDFGNRTDLLWGEAVAAVVVGGDFLFLHSLNMVQY